MKKNLFCILILINSFCFGNSLLENGYYKTLPSWTTTGVDLISGNSIVTPNRGDNIKDKTNLVSIRILYQNENKQNAPVQETIQYYNNGILIGKFRKEYETYNSSYVINNKGFIDAEIENGYENLKFQYVSDYERKLFFRGNYNGYEKISLEKNSYTCSYYDTRDKIERSNTYTFDKNQKIISFEERWYNGIGNIFSNSLIKYVYNKRGLLNSIIEYDLRKEDKKNYEVKNISYDKDDNIIEYDVVNYDNAGNINETLSYFYSNYDSQGNWLEGKCFFNGKQIGLWEREFKYNK